MITRRLLASLNLFRELPARELWEGALTEERGAPDWAVLEKAVAATLNHQSQEATDLPSSHRCRPHAASPGPCLCRGALSHSHFALSSRMLKFIQLVSGPLR